MATQDEELLGGENCLHVALRDPIKLRKPLLLKALEKSSKKEAPITDDDVVGSFVLTLTDKPPLLKRETYPSTHRRGFIQFHNSKIIDDETVVAECRLIFFRMMMAEKTLDSGDVFARHSDLDIFSMLALLKDLVYDWPTVYTTAMPTNILATAIVCCIHFYFTEDFYPKMSPLASFEAPGPCTHCGSLGPTLFWYVCFC